MLTVGIVTAEARLARRQIGQPFGLAGPQAAGLYGSGPGAPIELALLGDSTAAGLGADRPEQTPGAILATGLAAVSGRSVRLTNVAVVGSESAGLTAQVEELLADVPRPDVALILVGANDVTHRVKPATAVRALGQAVARLRDAGAGVVVGTCPDLGTVQPIGQPLRTLARRLSREMAAAQTIAAVEAGGRSVSLGDLLGSEFQASPRELFSSDRFHPSAAGYARLASAVLPSVYAAAGYWPDGGTERQPERRRGEGVAPVAQAAAAAVDEPGTEVAATEVAGSARSHAGRWALLLRRRRQPLPAENDRHVADGSGSQGPGSQEAGSAGTGADVPVEGPPGDGALTGQTHAAHADGARADGAQTDGARVAGAEADAQAEGAEPDGSRAASSRSPEAH